MTFHSAVVRESEASRGMGTVPKCDSNRRTTTNIAGPAALSTIFFGNRAGALPIAGPRATIGRPGPPPGPGPIHRPREPRAMKTRSIRPGAALALAVLWLAVAAESRA